MTDPTHLASDTLSMVIADRRSGMTYAAIAARHEVPDATVGRWCRRAGLGDYVRPKSTEPAAAYDSRWLERTFKRTSKTANDCWEWQGFRQAKGYGSTSYRGRSRTIHRIVYKIVHGVTLTSDQFVCHKCDNPPCCNPDHLLLADNDWNMADKTAKGRHHEMKVTHCPRGHAYDEANTEIKPNGSRSCRTCCRARQRIKAGWSADDAYSIPPIPQNEKTPRRWAGRKAA